MSSQRKYLIFFFCVGFSIILAAQEIQETAISVNIEVPVRVYKGNNFVNDLTIDDFEVYEDGVQQKIEAMYLIHKRNILNKGENIQNRDEPQTFIPDTSRSFYLFFEVVEYSPKLNEALDYFFKNILEPSDNLIIVTPMKEYQLKSGILNAISIETLNEEIIEILRKDSWAGNSEYRLLFDELTDLVKSMSPVARKIQFRERAVSMPGKNGLATTSPDIYETDDLNQKLTRYDEIMSRLEDIRDIDQTRLLNFADYLKDQQGQKYVFLFYQREFVPQIGPGGPGGSTPYETMKLVSSMGYFFRDIEIDIEKIKQAYADSSININFLFFTEPAEYIPGIMMAEHSEDIFTVFDEIAQATGGISTSSAKPEFLFERASDAVDSYYLLYYSPKNHISDGKFKTITVKVKGGNYRITHRAGYIAD